MSGRAVRVAIVGGGITGLAAASYLKREAHKKRVDLDLALVESEERLGGRIKTLRRDGFLIEAGPDSFAAHGLPMLNLLRDNGLGHELVRSTAAPTLIYTGRELQQIPAGVMLGVPTKVAPLLSTPLLSPSGKLEVLADLISRYPETDGSDESVESFLGRRFGAEFVERIAAPLLEAIHADRVGRMSAKAALPGFSALADSRTSVIRMLRRARAPMSKAVGTSGGVPPGPFASVRGGLGTVVSAIERQFSSDALYLGAPVERIEQNASGFLLQIQGGGSPLLAGAIVLAIPARAAGTMLGMSTEFQALAPLAPAAVASVALAYRREALPSGVHGTGFVVAADARCAISACTLVHAKWPHTVPAGHALLRCSVDLSRAVEYASVDDTRLADVVRRDLERILGVKAQPVFAVVTRWAEAMPRYGVGHFGRLAALKACVSDHFPGVFLAGASYGGAGLANCVQQGIDAATAALAFAFKASSPVETSVEAARSRAAFVDEFAGCADEACALVCSQETESC